MRHCKIYGPLARYDTVSGKCVCPEGYVRDEAKRDCVPVGGGDKEQPLPPDVVVEDRSSSWSWEAFAGGVASGVLLFWGARQVQQKLKKKPRLPAPETR